MRGWFYWGVGTALSTPTLAHRGCPPLTGLDRGPDGGGCVPAMTHRRRKAPLPPAFPEGPRKCLLESVSPRGTFHCRDDGVSGR